MASGEEADATRLLGAELDVGEVRGRNQVGVALHVGEAQVGGVLLESRGDLRADLVRARGGLEAELAAGVDDADADFHAYSCFPVDDAVVESTSEADDCAQLYRAVRCQDPTIGPVSP